MPKFAITFIVEIESLTIEDAQNILDESDIELTIKQPEDEPQSRIHIAEADYCVCG